MATDFGVASAGTEVIFTSCCDERHGPENIIDGNDRTFWITTGLYPQQFILQFVGEIEISKIKTTTTNVRKILVEKCVGMSPTAFETVYEVEVADRNGRIQVESNQIPKAVTARFLRITIESGWDDFASVHRISLDGVRSGS